MDQEGETGENMPADMLLENGQSAIETGVDAEGSEMIDDANENEDY
jgi:hypothetical protein